MKNSYLFPEERVLDTFPKVWFETPDRVDKVFTRFVNYIDTGWLVFTNMRIVFHGRKYLFPIDKISFVGRHRFPGKIGMGEGYVRVDTLDNHNLIKTYFFAGGGWWVWTVKRRSNELFGRIIAWNENVGRHTRF